MGISTSGELAPADFDDFELLAEAVLYAAGQPDATVKPVDEWKVFMHLERTYMDLDFLAWPPLSLSLTGLLKTFPGGSRMVLRYREFAHNVVTENSSLNHDYVLEAYDKELIEFGHTVRACPQIPEYRQEISNDTNMDLADKGRRILRQNLGSQLELTTGDCGVLFDRIMNLAD